MTSHLHTACAVVALSIGLSATAVAQSEDSEQEELELVEETTHINLEELIVLGSPIARTIVALTKDITMYAWYLSALVLLMVHTKLGVPCSLVAAISVTPSPGRMTFSVERGPVPHRL